MLPQKPIPWLINFEPTGRSRFERLLETILQCARRSQIYRKNKLRFAVGLEGGASYFLLFAVAQVVPVTLTGGQH